MRVLAHAVIAVSALGSADISIFNTEVFPVFNEDLRAFGKLRADSCRELTEHAFKLAKEEGVTVECSRENAALCMLLDFLKSRKSIQMATEGEQNLKLLGRSGSRQRRTYERI